ncbi:MAG: hypothetical protein KC420_14935 [Myxococcales bacterium]|nr:hypothetical protein [Myxococcales bacterium]MCB9703879.1 hypothetical protein [Myxococcales bacterium]
MRRLPALLVVSLLLACGAQSGAASAEPPGDDAAPPSDCDYEVKGTCYKDQAAACEAAGCTPDNCAVLESYPMQIECS